MKSDAEILKQRAHKLSINSATSEAHSEDSLSMIGFYMMPHEYCFESSVLKEVTSLRNLTVIPGVPPFIQGIFNLRGSVMSLMNLRKFLGISETGISDQNRIMIVSGNGFETGILVDKVGGLFRLKLHDVDAALPSFGGQHAEFVRGITKTGIIVLDIMAILDSKKILVGEK